MHSKITPIMKRHIACLLPVVLVGLWLSSFASPAMAADHGLDVTINVVGPNQDIQGTIAHEITLPRGDHPPRELESNRTSGGREMEGSNSGETSTSQQSSETQQQVNETQQQTTDAQQETSEAQQEASQIQQQTTELLDQTQQTSQTSQDVGADN